MKCQGSAATTDQARRQFPPRAHLQLVVNVTDMSAHGVDADRQARADFLVAQAIDQQLEDLALARTQVDSRIGWRAVKRFNDLAGNGPGHRRFSTRDLRDCLHDVLAGGAFEQVAAGAGFEGGKDAFLVLEHRQHDDGAFGNHAFEPGRRLDSVDARQADIHQDDVGWGSVIGVQGVKKRLGAIVRGDQMERSRRGHDAGQGGADGRLVFNDDDVYLPHARLYNRWTRRRQSPLHVTHCPRIRRLRPLSGLIVLMAGLTQLGSGLASPLGHFEQPAFSHLLPQRSALALLVDRNEGLWIATREGLARWDGHRMRYWRQHPFRSDSLGGNVMRGLLEDRRGDIWAFNYTGLHRGTEPTRLVAPTHEHAQRYAYPGAYALLDANGEVLLVHEGELLRYDAASDQFRSLLRWSGQAASPSTALAEPDAVWIATVDGPIHRCDPGRASCREVGPGDATGSSRASLLWRNAAGRLMAAVVDQGVFEIDEQHNRLVAHPDWPDAWRGALVRDVIRWHDLDVLVSSFGLIWRAEEHGPSCPEAIGRWCRRRVDRGDGLDDAMLLSARVDARGVLWLGSNWTLQFHDPRVGALDHWLSGTDSAMQDGWIMSLAEDASGAIWAGSFRGRLYRIDPGHGQIKLKLRLPEDNSDGSFLIIWDLLAVDSTLWIATSNGLIEFDPQSGRQREFFPLDIERSRLILDGELTPDLNSVQVMARAEDGSLWLGINGNGLRRFDPVQARFTRPLPEAPRWINHLMLDGEAIWLASANDGLHRKPFEGRYSQRYGHDPDDPATLHSNSVWMIHRGRSGRLWVGTDSGLLELDAGAETSRNVFDGLELPSRAAMSLAEDRLGHLWVGTNSGLVRVNLDTGAARRLGRRDGLKMFEFNRKAALRASDGTLYFGGDRGIVAVRPDRLTPEEDPPALRLDAVVRVDETASRVDYLGPDEAIIIAPDTRQFGVRLSSSELARPGRLRFQARIAGLERVWRDLGNAPEIRFNRVPPGRYRLEARVADSSGPWSSRIISRSLQVRPAIWQTGWFRSMVALAVAVLVVMITLYWQQRRNQARLRVLEQRRALAEERGRISRDMHDEVGTGLTEIVMLSEAAGRGNSRSDDTLASITGRSRELLDSIGSIIWALNPDNDRLDRLLAFLREATARQCEHAGCDTAFDFPDFIPPIGVRADFVRHLTLIVREAVTNALKHAGANCVTLRVALGATDVTLDISDDGCGFCPDQVEPRGNGLGNIQTRAVELAGSVTIESTPGAGSRVRVVIALARD